MIMIIIIIMIIKIPGVVQQVKVLHIGTGRHFKDWTGTVTFLDKNNQIAEKLDIRTGDVLAYFLVALAIKLKVLVLPQSKYLPPGFRAACCI